MIVIPGLTGDPYRKSADWIAPVSRFSVIQML